MKKKNVLLRAALAVVLLPLVSSLSLADATLDKINARGKLVVGVDGASPPFGLLDQKTGKIGGFQTDLGRDIARRLGVTLEVVPVTASTRVQFLQSGKVDLLIANIQWTQERSEALSYAPTPYNLVGGAALVRKDSSVQRWEDLKGKVACVSQGSNFTRPLQEYGAIVKGLRGIPESLLALKGGTCDASVHISPAMHQVLVGESASQWQDYRLGTPDQLIPSPTVIWTRRGEADTRKFVDDVIRDWHRSGSLLKLGQQYGVPDEYFRDANGKAQRGEYDAAPPEPVS
ncbi:transporter substrate-binding domain-containing protein [Affinibrenneria salicis]|uniref:Transporter substrate-binding domain-containing protein n=1 Tax=Affinibrenneria salicis TaxID=2590031 RepID=A0A5J5FT91_9GAMM|nr:transporter substrate-binding domain-containing protein [Affinibrenneria salicis]KAA8996445.1 transporter substrate-binding domain-containing protein [Affinibrenneria salicis]